MNDLTWLIDKIKHYSGHIWGCETQFNKPCSCGYSKYLEDMGRMADRLETMFDILDEVEK
jgi:hypothetical protein